MTLADQAVVDRHAAGHRRGARRPRHPIVRWGKRAVLLLAASAAALPAVVAYEIWYVAVQDERSPSDAIVVMGAAQYNGEPSKVFAARLDHAAELYHADVAPRIITVGGGLPGDNHTEAVAAARWLAEQAGVPRTRIVAKSQGHDTLQSLRAVDRAMESRGWTSAVIVTDPWHSLRCRTMARDMGVEAVTSPAREGNPLVGPLRVELRYVVREALAYVYYLLFRQSTEVEFFSI